MCTECRRKEVRRVKIPYVCERTFEGRTFVIDLPELDIQKCGHCGTLWFSNTEIDAIDRELRRQAGVLQPEEIRAGRAALGLTPEELSRRLGVPDDQVSRWEQGLEFHTRSADESLRVLFAASPTAALRVPSTPNVAELPRTADV